MANAAVKQAVAKRMGGPVATFRPGAPAPGSAPRPPAAPSAQALTAARPRVREAARAYTGLLAAPLNELSAAERRTRDVAARRQADAQQYSAFVMGQQGAIAAAAQRADRTALDQTMAVQGAAAAANEQGQQALQAARAAQGIGGAVPSQQLGGLVDDQQRTNLLLAAGSQRLADRANTNQGKAGFLREAARSALMANQRAIAGDEFEQTSKIRGEKVGLLAQRDELKAAQKAAEEAARADIEEARIRASENALDRASREAISSADNISAENRAAAGRALTAQQGRANRRVRLRTSQTGAAALGYVSPADQRRRNNSLNKLEQQRSAAEQLARRLTARRGGRVSPENLALVIRDNVSGAPQEVIDYAVGRALGRGASNLIRGRGRNRSTATSRYRELQRRIRRGELG